MNKTAIKNYAIWARVNLIEAAKQKAFEYEITENGEMKTGIDSVGGRLLSKAEKEQRNTLIAQIRQKGFNQVMEEVAYTWFNRFIALRFMEVNGYLPSKVRIFTDENGVFKPEILKEATRVELEGIDRDIVIHLLDKQDNEGLYKYLLITQCNALNAALPGMFEKIANYTELLFPNNLLKQDSVIGRMISDIPEEDWTDAVQIIGWLYQYYNSELKDETFALLKKNVKITKERIPAATQLFTPDWIVRYMVENSLGRLWYEGHKNDELKSTWKYYLDEAEQEPEVEEQLKNIRAEYAQIKPEDIKVIDPCMGSGHILVYAFDVLMQIYTSAGWSERDAAKSILENNLYGLDIDDRAGQLAYFAVMMKARKYNRRVLTMGITPNVMSIQDSGFMTDDLIEYVASRNTDIRADLRLLRKDLKDAKELGSIINVTKLNYPALYTRIAEIEQDFPEDLMTMANRTESLEKLLPLVKQAQVMSQKYDVVVTNPPYMSASGMSSKLVSFIKEKYPTSKGDLFACFIERCNAMVNVNRYQAMITQHSWMFLSDYKKLREQLINRNIINMAHLGARAFEEIGGEVVQTTSFVFRKSVIGRYKAIFVRLVEQTTQEQKEKLFVSGENRYSSSNQNFRKVPDNIYSYWLSETILTLLDKGSKLESFGDARQGLTTTDNKRFLRLWFEINHKRIDYSCDSCQSIANRESKWFPYNKAGSYRKWSSIDEFVVNYENNGAEIKESVMQKYPYLKTPGFVVKNTESYFKHGITWNDVSTGSFCCRYVPDGYIFADAGPMFFSSNDFLMMAYFNSVVFQTFADVICQGLHYSTGHIPKIPFLRIDDKSTVEKVEGYAKENHELSKREWDSFEVSWDFKRNPLVNGNNLSAAYAAWKQECEGRFQQLKKNEEELNRIFIDIYGLQDELTPDVADKDVTVHRVFNSKDDVPESMKGSNYVRTMRDEIVSLISYAVGCMFGRYSLDVDGLAYAGGEWDASKYKTIIPDGDNIIPICDDDYFDDDITGRFVKWVENVYGSDTLEENLKFIADALGGKGTPREVIRSYFLNDFYADHLKTYQKRPIYWLFDSGKKNGFKALIYMHRYQPDLLARMRTDYVHEQQERYRTQLSMIEDSVKNASASDRVKLNKQIEKLRAQEVEIRSYEEKIHHLADQMIAIDLDDGVKVNYEKFKDVLTKIK